MERIEICECWKSAHRKAKGKKHLRRSVNPYLKNTAQGSFYKLGLTLIPAWISNYIHYRVWRGITYPFQIQRSLGMNNLFHPTLYCAYVYLSMLELS